MSQKIEAQIATQKAPLRTRDPIEADRRAREFFTFSNRYTTHFRDVALRPPIHEGSPRVRVRDAFADVVHTYVQNVHKNPDSPELSAIRTFAEYIRLSSNNQTSISSGGPRPEQIQLARMEEGLQTKDGIHYEKGLLIGNTIFEQYLAILGSTFSLDVQGDPQRLNAVIATTILRDLDSITTTNREDLAKLP